MARKETVETTEPTVTKEWRPRSNVAIDDINYFIDGLRKQTADTPTTPKRPLARPFPKPGVNVVNEEVVYESQDGKVIKREEEGHNYFFIEKEGQKQRFKSDLVEDFIARNKEHARTDIVLRSVEVVEKKTKKTAVAKRAKPKKAGKPKVSKPKVAKAKPKKAAPKVAKAAKPKKAAPKISKPKAAKVAKAAPKAAKPKITKAKAPRTAKPKAAAKASKPKIVKKKAPITAKPKAAKAAKPKATPKAAKPAKPQPKATKTVTRTTRTTTITSKPKATRKSK